MENLLESTKGNNANTLLVAGGWNKYNVIVRRNYYGEIQEEQRTIEGETFERAKFYFNMSSLLWSVVSACNSWRYEIEAESER